MCGHDQGLGLRDVPDRSGDVSVSGTEQIPAERSQRKSAKLEIGPVQREEMLCSCSVWPEWEDEAMGTAAHREDAGAVAK